MNSAVESGSTRRLNFKPNLWFDLLYGLLPLVVVVLQLSAEFQTLWSSASTRYFGIPILFVFGIVVVNSRSPRTVVQARIGFSRLIFVLAVLLFGLSVWQFSPWLTHVSLVVFFASWSLRRFGSVAWPRVLAWTILLATSVRMGEGSTVELRTWVVRNSAFVLGNILDGLGIPNLIQADKFNMLNLEFSMTECCDGFFSIHALTSLVVLMLLLSHRSLLVAAISVLSVPFWSIVQNVLLLLTIVLLRHYGERDASQGLDYVLLQFVAFLTVAVSCWITIWFVSQMLQPVPAADSQFEIEFRVLNALLCWPQPDPFAPDILRRKKEVVTEPSENPKQSFIKAMRPIPWVATTVLVALGIFSMTRWLDSKKRLANLPAHNVDLGEYAWQNTFPPSFDQWRQLATSYGTMTEDGITRSVIDWQFDWSGQILQLQVTFPYNRRPSFADRYISQGWQVLKEEPRRYVPKPSKDMVPAIETDPTYKRTVAPFQDWSELSIANELGGRATAMVAYHHIDGQIEINEREVPGSLSYQVVLFCESGQELSRQQQLDLNRGFQLADERIQGLIEPHLRELVGGKP